MNILVINNGSATLKLDVLEVFPADVPIQRMAQARVEQFGSAASKYFGESTSGISLCSGRNRNPS